jgi:hypothetical protein
MRVTVFHKADREGTSFDRMCVVEAPCTDVMDALEYAYRWTNNINGSWSRSDNADSNENVTEIAPLVDGMGHRSTSMFDRMAIEGAWYEVAGFGFEKIEVTESKKQTKKELVAEMIERVGLEDRKTLINLIVNTLNVTKANAGVYVYNFKKARGL